MSELEQRVLRMAVSVRGKPITDWPAWSTGELLMVGLVLNDDGALDVMGFTILEALDRVDLDAQQLRALERHVQRLQPEEQIDGSVLWR